MVAWLLTYLLHSTILLGGACVLCAVGVVRSNAAKDTLWKVALIGGLLTATFQLALRVEPYAGNALLTPGSESALIAVATRRTPSPVFPAAMRESAGAPALEAAMAGVPALYRPDEPPVVVAGEAPPAGAGAPSRRFRRVLNGIHVSWPAALLHLWFSSRQGPSASSSARGEAWGVFHSLGSISAGTIAMNYLIMLPSRGMA